MCEFGGALHALSLRTSDTQVTYSFPEIGDNSIYTAPLYQDDLSGIRYFFAKLPIAYLFHDTRINPRAIGGNMRNLLEEFFEKRPQLHVSLAWAQIEANQTKSKVFIFDGQHKVAAQVLLGVRQLPVRVFINPDLDVLLTTNTNAGTTLRQVAFPTSVQRYLGSEIYRERIARYQQAHGQLDTFYGFSEQDLVAFFKGEAKEIRRYVLDDVRASVTHHADNKLKDFVDLGGRGNERPLSYSTLEKTVYSRFVGQEMLERPIDDRLDLGENPRQLEKEQLVRVLNIVAEEIFIGKFSTALGTYRIERRIVDHDDQDITDDHLRAFRMSREEVLYNWLTYLDMAIKQYYLLQSGVPYDEKALLQSKLPESLWASLRRVVHNLSSLPLWVDRELARTTFGGKQSHQYWNSVFKTGKTSDGAHILTRGLELNELLRE
jgi:hypothetical protein